MPGLLPAAPTGAQAQRRSQPAAHVTEPGSLAGRPCGLAPETSKGCTETDARCWGRVTRLPRFLVLHMKRFQKNQFFREKNPTIVNFPVKNLALGDIIPLPPGGARPESLPRLLHAAELGLSGDCCQAWLLALCRLCCGDLPSLGLALLQACPASMT